MKFCSKLLNPYRLSIMKHLFESGHCEYWESLKNIVNQEHNEKQSDGKFHHLLNSLVEMEIVEKDSFSVYNHYHLTKKGKQTYLEILEYFKTFLEQKK